MPPSEQVATEAAKPFESLARLRAEHLNMMRSVRRDRYDQEQVERVRQFVGRIKATGTLIASPAGRDTAQGALDYWNAYLFMAADRAALSAAPPDLDPFDPANAPDLSTMASPYQGLAPFGEEDAGRLFGREEAVKDVLDKLREQPVVLVIGPTGSGKSSLVMAGVIPRLKSRMINEKKDPVFPVALPGADPFAALLKSIHEAAADPALPGLDSWISEQKKKLERSPAQLRRLLETTFPGRAVIIVVDQFEQVFTLCSDAKAREQFAQALIGICPDARGPNRIILIVDQNYQQAALQLAALKQLAENPAARFSLPALSAAEVRRIIESVAATVGLKFDEGIVESLVSETAGDVAALPLLQFTLDKLWNRRRGDRITADAYREVGRPRDALTRTAEAVFDSLSSDEREAARKLFLELVQPPPKPVQPASGASSAIIPAGRFIRRRVRRDALLQLDSSDSMARVLERYVEAELIRRTSGVSWDDDRFDVPHEALINSWPRLRDWLQKEQDESEKVLQLIATAQRYRDSGFKGYLLSGDALDEAAAYTAAAPELSELVAESIKESRRQSQRDIRNKTVAISVMAVLLAAAVVGGALAGVLWLSAQRSLVFALDSVSSESKMILGQVNTGVISTKAAQELLTTPEFDLFAAPNFREQLATREFRLFASPRFKDLLAPLNTFTGWLASLMAEQPAMTKARVDLLTTLSDIHEEMGDHQKTREFAEQAKDLAQQLVKNDPKNDEWQHLRYGALFRVGDTKEEADPEGALQDYQDALGIAQMLAEKDLSSNTRQQDIAFIDNKIGDLSVSKEEWEEALVWYGKALKIGNDLLDKAPESEVAQKTAADARQSIGQLRAKQAGKQKQTDVLVKEELWKKAIVEYQEASKLRESLAKNFPDNAIYQSNLATSYRRAGDSYKELNKLPEARQQYEKALKILDDLARRDRANAGRQSALASQFVRIAELLRAMQDKAGALENYRSALTIREGLANRFSDERDHQRQLADTYELIGDTLRAQGESRKAQDEYQKGLGVIEAFMRNHPDSGLERARETMLKKIQSLPPSVQ
jgi:tetratricopeptide (TPR) repeat protein